MNFWTIIVMSLTAGAAGYYWISINEEKAAAKAKEATEATAKSETRAKADKIEPYSTLIPWPTRKNEKINKFWHEHYYFEDMSNISNIYEHVISDILTTLGDCDDCPSSTDVRLSHISVTDRSLYFAKTLLEIAQKESKASLSDRRTYECLIVGLYHTLDNLPGRRWVPLITSLPTWGDVQNAIQSRGLRYYCSELAKFAQIAEKAVTSWEFKNLEKEKDQPSLPAKTGKKAATKSKSRYKCDPKNPQPMPPELFTKEDFKEALKLKIDKVVKDGEKNKYKWLSCSEGEIIYFKQDTIYETLNEISGKELDIPEENIELRIKWIYGALRACEGIINWDKMGEPGFSAIPCVVDRWFIKEENQWLTPLNADWFSLSANILKYKYKGRDIIELVKSITQPAPPPPKKGGPNE